MKQSTIYQLKLYSCHWYHFCPYSGEAVPCAIFAFLKCSQDSFQELIPYSISLGGDTDTIASMAGAIGGAFWGVEKIPQEWRDCCEESSRAVTLADSLYDLVHQDVESQE